ncbi:hypothetical protein [Bradyrhizobium sp. JYMT SZCCT0180]|uniref:hypothetical protein n=1 Tax=Bradyrhizobium sp. JYMT SZCCT0180 TaxID=2807666 RepID=UPI001BA968E8|nr:hypothetical protein [Bradyrhizobium sp. JYMT SZCCT0180]MBR1216151.1 hypothetical protein [Bradyrhizobium sp. JYMT SZCCT0180]
MSDQRPKTRNSLIDETLSIVQDFSADSLKAEIPSAGVQAVLRDALSLVLSPKDRLAIDRAMMQRRVEKFRENQQKFQREREEYYNKTMEAAQATQFAPPKFTSE